MPPFIYTPPTARPGLAVGYTQAEKIPRTSVLVRGIVSLLLVTRSVGQSRFALLQARRCLRGTRARRMSFLEMLPRFRSSRLGVRRDTCFFPASLPENYSGIPRRARHGSTRTTCIATLPSPSVVNRRSGQCFLRLSFYSVDKTYIIAKCTQLVKSRLTSRPVLAPIYPHSTHRKAWP